MKCRRHERTNCQIPDCRFDRIDEQQTEILNLLRRLIVTVKELELAVDAETNRIADAFAALLAKANDRNLTADEQTQGEALIAHLKSIGADSTNPVPAAPPATGLPPGVDNSGNPIT